MDFFHGHSWASGLGNSAGARAQESSSEAINAYYSLALLAESLGDQTLKDYSRMLLAIELAGSMQYWHLYPNVNDPDTPYPEKGLRDLITIGIVMDASAGAWLYWGSQHIQIAAIQMLPLTPIGLNFYDVPWMTNVLEYCMDEITDITIGDAFKSGNFSEHFHNISYFPI
jgi:endo-1,3(4)-beta-glucanase